MATASAKGVKAMESIWNFMTQHKGFERVLQGFNFLEGGKGTCVAEIEVKDEHLNRQGSLHGGFTITAVDAISTCAYFTVKQSPGVSVDLHVTYLKAAHPGDKIIFDASTVKAGRNLAFFKVDVREKITGNIIARGNHTIYIFDN